MKKIIIFSALALLTACQPSQEALLEQQLDSMTNRMNDVKAKLLKCLELSKENSNTYDCKTSFKEIQVHSEATSALTQEAKYGYLTGDLTLVAKKQDEINFHFTAIENILNKYNYL
ncbi:hypothetical protein STA3757_06950 [Stanieria sp. NIES-3757]|nr:hypothetical protein STA3757_06950 [Stanieria sp. NIES-3757]